MICLFDVFGEKRDDIFSDEEKIHVLEESSFEALQLTFKEIIGIF